MLRKLLVIIVSLFYSCTKEDVPTRFSDDVKTYLSIIDGATWAASKGCYKFFSYDEPTTISVEYYGDCDLLPHGMAIYTDLYNFESVTRYFVLGVECKTIIFYDYETLENNKILVIDMSVHNFSIKQKNDVLIMKIGNVEYLPYTTNI